MVKSKASVSEKDFRGLKQFSALAGQESKEGYYYTREIKQLMISEAKTLKECPYHPMVGKP